MASFYVLFVRLDDGVVELDCFEKKWKLERRVAKI